MAVRRSLSRRLFRRIPLPLLAMLIGLVAGSAVWVVIDRVQTQSLRTLFQDELEDRLQQRARESLLRFEHFVQSYEGTAHLLAHHRRLAGYLRPLIWSPDEAFRTRVYMEDPPDWLPHDQQWRTLADPSHVLLLDTTGRIREEYRVRGNPLPEGSAETLAILPQNAGHAHFTAFQGQPYLLVSEMIEDGGHYIMGSLLILIPLDDAFLRASQQHASPGETVVALLGTDQQVLASSHPQSLPDGVARKTAEQDFVVTAQSFSQYDDASVDLLFATLIPKAGTEATRRTVLDMERRQRLIGAAVFVLLFSLLFVLVSERLNRVLRRISDFSRRALGLNPLEIQRGNQLLVLEDWMREFTQLVLSAREEMRARHEDEMRESEALKSAIMNTSLDSIIAVDETGRIIDFNPTAVKSFGITRARAIGRQINRLIIAESSRKDFQYLLDTCLVQSLDMDSAARKEMEAVSADGTRFPVEVSIKPLLLKEHLLFTVYLHDISKRRKQEQEIRSLAAFPSESPMPVLRVNRRGVIIYANSPSEPLLEYWGVERLQTMPLYWCRKVDAVLTEGEEEEMEVKTDGRTFTLLLSPIPDLSYVNIYARDITETRTAEEQSRQHQTELVHVCRLSTMGEMATGMAHELNQPLSAIVNYANGCARRLRLGVGTSEELLEPLEQISSQARRAGEIIKRLRGMIGKQAPIRGRADVNELVREVCSFVEFETRKMGLTIELDLYPRPLYVKVDLVQVEQVILNLVRNALDALQDRDEKERHLVLRSGRRPGQRVFIAVEDNGPGIPPKVMENLFNPFYTTKSSGMGMGLAISQTIVDDHNGRIRAETCPGGGSCFIVELPEHLDMEGSVAV